MAAQTGRRIVEMVWEDVKLSDILTRAAFLNSITTVLAIGGSTNAIVHLIAMARRIGVKLGLEDFEELSRRTPFLANIRPSGAYLMEDFYYAGGLPALLVSLGDLLDTDAVTANGKTLGENIADAKVFNDDVIRSRDNPIIASDTPGGAVRQPGTGRRGDQAAGGGPEAAAALRAAPSCSRTTTTWPPGLTIPTWWSTRTRCWCCRTPARRARPGMPEWGSCRSRRSCCKQGVRDMVRISDARMSGTSYGACVLHVAPESFIGGPARPGRDRGHHRTRRARARD